MEGLSPRAFEWLLTACKYGGTLALCAVIDILEYHEQYEECAFLREAIALAEGHGGDPVPEDGWRVTGDTISRVLERTGGMSVIMDLDKNTYLCMIECLGLESSEKLILDYKFPLD